MMNRPHPPFDVLHRSGIFRFPPILLQHGAPTPADRDIQYVLSLRLAPQEHVDDHAAEQGTDFLVDFGAADQLALTARISRHAFCNFTGWCKSSVSFQITAACTRATVSEELECATK